MALSDTFEDLDRFLSDEPDFDTDPEPEPAADLAKANGILRTLGARRRELARQEELCAAERQRLDEWIERERERIGKTIAWLETWLANWHRAQLAEDRRRKTVHLPNGTLKSEAQQPAWTFAEEFIAWAEANAPALLRRKPAPGPQVEVNAAKKALAPLVADGRIVTEHGEVVPGVTVVVRGPKFTATPET